MFKKVVGTVFLIFIILWIFGNEEGAKKEESHKNTIAQNSPETPRAALEKPTPIVSTIEISFECYRHYQRDVYLKYLLDVYVEGQGKKSTARSVSDLLYEANEELIQKRCQGFEQIQKDALHRFSLPPEPTETARAVWQAKCDTSLLKVKEAEAKLDKADVGTKITINELVAANNDLIANKCLEPRNR